MTIDELIQDLQRRATAAADLANDYAADIRHAADYVRCRGKADAYAHAAELAREFKKAQEP